MPVIGMFYRSLLWRGLLFISAFILNVLIARHYQASVSGQIFYRINLYAFIILMVSLSLESAMGYYISKNEISLNSLINFCFTWAVFIAIGTVLFMAVKNGNSPTQIDFLAISFICGNLLSNYCAGISYAKRNFFLPNIINIATNLSLIFLLLFMEVFSSALVNDNAFLVIFFSSFLLQGVGSLIALRITYLKRWRPTFLTITEIKKLYRFGLTAFFANLISFLLYRVDYWFVAKYCDAGDLGNYIQVSKLAQVFFILPGMLAGIIFPLTAGGQKQYVNDMLATISRLIFVLYLCCCILLTLTGYWLFPLLFGNSFKDMYSPFLLLIPGILSLSTLYTLTAYYAGKNKMSVNIKGASLALIFIVSADAFFIPKYGIRAAALITSIGYIIYHIYVLRIFSKEYNSPALSFFNFRLADIEKIKRSFLNTAGKNNG